MAGHLSKNKDFDLYVYNRTDEVADRWLNKHDGSKFILNNSPNLKFHGLIICLKDDHSIVDWLKYGMSINSGISKDASKEARTYLYNKYVKSN